MVDHLGASYLLSHPDQQDSISSNFDKVLLCKPVEGATVETQSNKLDPCLICGDPAFYRNYGAKSCDSCRDFFKRTVEKNCKYRCIWIENCPINSESRRNCRFCRFKRCLNVGMRRERVRKYNLRRHLGRQTSPTNQLGPS